MPRNDLKDVINVSMAFPIINGPHKFNRKFWIDGGATDNIPVLPLTYYDCDMVIILHCYPKYYPPEDLYNKLKPGTIVIDIDVTLDLPKDVTSFSLNKNDFNLMIKIGEKINNRYRLVSRIAQGGMAEVYEAIDLENKKISIKESYYILIKSIEYANTQTYNHY